MSTSPLDVAAIRRDNALALFDEFVLHAARRPDAATLRGLEGRFAERLGIQPSYWSQIKSRSRLIGERLARQFEEAMSKPRGWLDQPHAAATALPPSSEVDSSVPRDDDERFVVGLVLSYYRRNPARARTRLLDLLSEALTPAVAPPPPAAPASTSAADEKLWASVAQHVAPLKRKR